MHDRGRTWRRISGGPWPALICGVLVLMAALVVSGQSVSGGLTVSVTVVRSCSVATLPALAATHPTTGEGVVISCGGPSSGATLDSARVAIVPVAGARAGAAVSTTRTDGNVQVSVNF